MDQTINWYEKSALEVYTFLHKKTDENQRYAVFKDLMFNYPDLKINWFDTFETLTQNLPANKRLEDLQFFVNWYSSKNPDDYKKGYEFVERDLCNCYLFIDDSDKLQERINFIQQNPDSAIDTLTIRLLYQLIYHGKFKQAFDYSEKVWKTIQKSDDLIGSTEFDFVNSIYMNKLQNYFVSFQKKNNFDTSEMFKSVVKLGFDDDKELFEKVVHAVENYPDKAYINQSIENDKKNIMLYLNIQFMKFMYQQYNMPFILSDKFWSFIHTLKIFGKHKGTENWFYIDAKTLDKHILDKYDNIFRSNDLEVFGKVFGLKYVIKFFKHLQLISDEQYEIMKENIVYFENAMIRIAGSSLWQMMFIFNWPVPDDYITDNNRKDLFKSTFEVEESKSDVEIRKYCSQIPVSGRLERELNVNKNRTPESFWSEKTPFIKEEQSAGRNEPCPCGSGKKYKKCCMNKK